MISNLWALIKAVPVLINTFKQLQELYISEQVAKIEGAHISKEDERFALMEAINNATTNNQIMAHSVTLHRLNSNV